jgi:pyridinium-3,5-biscarboxylic acid mononucleotide synthase
MDAEKIRELLISVQEGRLGVQAALEELRTMPYEYLDFATLDTHRALRTGMPEVVFCQGKTIEQLVTIFEHLWQHHDRIMGTRATPEIAAAVEERLPQANYNPNSRILTLARNDLPPKPADAPYALVLTAGTADIPVAEEAVQTLEFLGSRTMRAYDVGVAGLHRLLDKAELLSHADIILSVAGMEGALTSVVAGLVYCPVVGVPTSVGYGASFNGLSALLAMLNSCAPGVVVVNIDNGFGAGRFAHIYLSRLTQPVQDHQPRFEPVSPT